MNKLRDDMKLQLLIWGIIFGLILILSFLNSIGYRVTFTTIILIVSIGLVVGCIFLIYLVLKIIKNIIKK